MRVIESVRHILLPCYSPKTHPSRLFHADANTKTDVDALDAAGHPPGGGTPQRVAVAHTAGVTKFDSEHSLTTTRSATPNCDGTSDIGPHQLERRRKPPRASLTATVNEATPEQSARYLTMATAQLIEAACLARDGDSHGARAHVTRAIALLDGHPERETARQAGERNFRQIPRGRFAAWQSQRLAAHVDANLARKIVIKELAGSLDISVGHFCRAFKCTFGMPAGIWIRQRRIEFAQGLMLTTRAPLCEIALNCGMSDQSHFTRTFRRIVGEAPSSWRQTRHGAIEERVTGLAYPGTTKPIA
jgi:AraC family transcriptional regulator